ncbi:MAG TPA: potassium-transporting ATPase subunit KdpA [Anaeromyxobacteraceae bacterium]|nr:potassium-transporting ATPase subunit KdpA [Anaeromyxobacteraceae bacterium]
MTSSSIVQLALYVGALLLLMKPLGLYMARVYDGSPGRVGRILGPVERFIYRASGIDPAHDMGWKTYALAVLLFNFAGALLLYAILRLQNHLPLNPYGFGAISPDLAFNTTVSFLTNTNWQSYSGENVMSQLSQVTGLMVQHFVCAASAMAVMVALIRGLARKQSGTIGNFWADMVRTNLYILLPLALVLAVVLAQQGVPQTLGKGATATLLQPTSYDDPVLGPDGKPLNDSQGKPVTKKVEVKEQEIPTGPAAAFVAIKQLGSNGGGYYNANSAHPFENPTPLTNFLELLVIPLLAAGSIYMFSRMVGDTRQGWALTVTVTALLVVGIAVAAWAEHAGNPKLTELGVDQAATSLQSGGNMEGKELRVGAEMGAIWGVSATATSNGSVNSMHDSWTPLGGLVPLIMMDLGEVVFGGVGCGLYGLLLFVFVAVFIAGLMVGRTPEYLGKKIESYEVKMAAIALLTPVIAILAGSALAVVTASGRAGVANPGPHGFSEIFYAFSSAGQNNGSAFAGINANTPFYNTSLGIVILFGRFWPMIPVLAIAGSVAAKKSVPVTAGTLPTHTPLFMVMLVSVILIIGALTYFPALALGPIVEHLML